MKSKDNNYELSSETIFRIFYHNLKNALSLIALYANDAYLSKNPKEYSTAILHQCDDIQRLMFNISFLLSCERINKPILVNGNELDRNIRLIIDSFHLQKKDKSLIKYTAYFTEESTEIFLNIEHFRQALINLIENAIKYRKPISIINIRLEQDNESYILTITNKGEYLDDLSLKHALELGWRSEEAIKYSRGCLGIGLTVVNKLALENGWRFYITSNHNMFTANLTLE